MALIHTNYRTLLRLLCSLLQWWVNFLLVMSVSVWPLCTPNDARTIVFWMCNRWFTLKHSWFALTSKSSSRYYHCSRQGKHLNRSCYCRQMSFELCKWIYHWAACTSYVAHQSASSRHLSQVWDSVSLIDFPYLCSFASLVDLVHRQWSVL